MEPGILDDIIRRLVEFRNTRPGSGKQVHLSEGEIRQLCAVSKEIFLQQPNLLELEAPIKICGQIFVPFAQKVFLLFVLEWGFWLIWVLNLVHVITRRFFSVAMN